MAKKAKKDIKFVIRCSHCFENEFRLDDVDHTQKIKHYTDTPMKYTTTRNHPGVTVGHFTGSSNKQSSNKKHSPYQASNS